MRNSKLVAFVPYLVGLAARQRHIKLYIKHLMPFRSMSVLILGSGICFMSFTGLQALFYHVMNCNRNASINAVSNYL